MNRKRSPSLPSNVEALRCTRSEWPARMPAKSSAGGEAPSRRSDRCFKWGLPRRGAVARSTSSKTNSRPVVRRGFLVRHHAVRSRPFPSVPPGSFNPGSGSCRTGLWIPKPSLQVGGASLASSTRNGPEIPVSSAVTGLRLALAGRSLARIEPWAFGLGSSETSTFIAAVGGDSPPAPWRWSTPMVGGYPKS